eukprot:m.518111 g.518111  ORF g.518111 m.518111 type:complete len:135 (-) comp21938_c0_seq4:42-446(-)
MTRSTHATTAMGIQINNFFSSSSLSAESPAASFKFVSSIPTPLVAPSGEVVAGSADISKHSATQVQVLRLSRKGFHHHLTNLTEIGRSRDIDLWPLLLCITAVHALHPSDTRVVIVVTEIVYSFSYTHCNCHPN